MKTLKKEKFIVDAKGKRKAAVLDIKDYEAMLEDIEDLKTLAERRNEPTCPPPGSGREEVKETWSLIGLLSHTQWKRNWIRRLTKTSRKGMIWLVQGKRVHYA